MNEFEFDNRKTGTVAQLFVDRVRQTPDKPALFWNENGGNDDSTSWTILTWEQLSIRVGEFAAAFQERNIGHGSLVVLISENRMEWIVADLAIQMLGAVNVPLHSELTSKQVCELVNHCQPELILVSNQHQLEKLNALETPPVILTLQNIRATRTMAFGTLATNVESIEPDDLVSILYTSGTTGEPKGVMLTHLNVRSNVFSKLATLPLGPNDIRLCILPFSHVFARVCDLYTWIAAGCELWLSRGWDLIFQDLRKVRPTFINGVPYFYEKCYRKLEHENRLAAPDALNKLLGGRTNVCNCGGAALADHVYDYFDQHDVGLVNGYGLTETSPVVTSCRLHQGKRGSVGPAIPGVKIKLADDGEVLVQGDNVMKGYFKDELATNNVINNEWFHTGDIGRIDKDGFLFIVGRKKEIIITNGAKNIAPIPIENQLNSHPAIDQSFVFGDRQDYLVALIVLSPNFAAENAFENLESEFRAIIDQQTISFSKYEQIGRFAILAEPFSIENGMLTAKRSLRRDNIATTHRETILSLYEK